MFSTRNLTRLAVGGSALVLASVVALGVAAPAFAEDLVQVNLGGLSSSLAAGGQRDNFSVTLRNRTNQPYVGVRRTFTIRLPGLQAGGVRIFRGFGQELPQQQSGPDEVQLTDPQEADLLPAGQRGNNRTANFQIQFMNNAPQGQAQVTVVASVGGQVLGSDNDSINVRAFGGPRDTRSSTPPATSSVPPATFQAQSPASPLATVQDPKVVAANASGKSAPWILYVLGGILVAAGGAILWLLFRTPRSDYVDLPTGAHEPVRPMGLGYPSPNVRPSAPHVTQPTRIMPAVPGPYQQQPPPASDPWASPSDGPTLIQ